MHRTNVPGVAGEVGSVSRLVSFICIWFGVRDSWGFRMGFQIE